MKGAVRLGDASCIQINQGGVRLLRWKDRPGCNHGKQQQRPHFANGYFFSDECGDFVMFK